MLATGTYHFPKRANSLVVLHTDAWVGRDCMSFLLIIVIDLQNNANDSDSRKVEGIITAIQRHSTV